MEQKWLKFTAFTGAALGCMYILGKFLTTQTPPHDNIKPVMKRAVCNRLDLAYVTNWAGAMQNVYGGDTYYLVSRINSAAMGPFASDMLQKGLDIEKHVILAAVNNETDRLLEMLLVNFQELDDDLISLMDDDGFFVIRN